METLATYGPTVSLIFFFLFFIGILVRTLRPSAKARLEALAYLPLKEDTHG